MNETYEVMVTKETYCNGKFTEEVRSLVFLGSPDESMRAANACWVALVRALRSLGGKNKFVQLGEALVFQTFISGTNQYIEVYIHEED